MSVTDDINFVYRDWNTPGDPGSGEYEPEKPRIRALMRSIAGGTAAVGEFRGEWDAGDDYIATDLVEYGGSIWYAIADSTNVTPIEGATWMLFLPGASVADGTITLAKLEATVREMIEGVQMGWSVGISVPASPATDCVTDAQDLIDATPDGGVIVLPPNTYRIGSAPVDGSALYVTDGDPTLGIATDIALVISGRKDITIDARGSTFLVDGDVDGFSVLFYKSINSKWVGGRFIGDSSFKDGIGEASAIAVVRSLGVDLEKVYAETFYRDFMGYRSSLSKMKECEAHDGGYFGLYLSGLLDVSSGVLAAELRPPAGSGYWFADKCIMEGNRYGNAYSAEAIWENCQFLNPGRDGVDSAQMRGERGYTLVSGGEAVDTSDQNTGFAVDGFLFAAGSDAATPDPDDGAYPTCAIRNMLITGHRIAMDIIGVDTVSVSGNRILDFYLAGVSARSDFLGGDAYPVRGASIFGNTIGRMKSGSTVSPFGSVKRAGIQLDAGGTPTQDCWGSIAGNILNVHATQPDATYYEIATNLSLAGVNISFSANTVKGAGVNDLDP